MLLWPLYLILPKQMGAISKFYAQPTESHFTAVKRVLRYSSGTNDLSLRSINHQLATRMPMAGELGDRHSTSGYLFVYGGGVITWSSKKQAVSLTSPDHLPNLVR